MADIASPEIEQNLQRATACNSSSSPSGGFDCNICLENATEPVVTLCGHLFCWPCIYKWLHLDQNINNKRHCPVCKSSVSQNSLVPLYAGKSLGTLENIPRRPSAAAPPPPGNEFRQQLSLLGGNAVAVLPWMLGEHWMGLYYTNPYQRLYCSDPRLRRQETRDRGHLHRLSVFLFFCSVLCLLLF